MRRKLAEVYFIKAKSLLGLRVITNGPKCVHYFIGVIDFIEAQREGSDSKHDYCPHANFIRLQNLVQRIASSLNS